MRVETLDAATKEIGASETGELYLVDRAAGMTITLPPLKDGAYVKFIVVDEIDGGDLVIKGAETTHYIVGALPVYAVDAGGDGTCSVAAAKGTTKDILTITDDDGIHEGSWVEFVSDGSYWYMTGWVLGGDEGTIAVVA
jgi:hypothetical protein